MKFQVSEIRDAHTLQRTEDIEPWDLITDPPEFVSLRRPLKTKVQAHMTQNGIIVSGDIKTIITTECARCLESVERPYQVRFQQVFNPDLEEIDVSNDIRESVLIDLPFKALCSENCQGLCPSCGKNRNKSSCGCAPQEDSRFDSLKQFPFK